MRSPREVPRMLPGERVYTREEWLEVIAAITDVAELTERLSPEELDELERAAFRDRARRS